MIQLKNERGLSVRVTDNREARLDVSYKTAVKEWLAISVKIYHEQKVSEKLIKTGIESFVAKQQEYKQYSDRIKLVNRVVLPMIVFVHIPYSQRNQIFQVSSVIRYVTPCGEHHPAIIPDSQIEKFKFMLDCSSETVNITNAPIRPGVKIKVVKGPLTGMQGEIIIINSERRVGISLNLLGYAYIDIPISYLEIL